MLVRGRAGGQDEPLPSNGVGPLQSSDVRLGDVPHVTPVGEINVHKLRAVSCRLP